MTPDTDTTVALILEHNSRGMQPVSYEQAVYARLLKGGSAGKVVGLLCGAGIEVHAREFADRTGIDIIGWNGEPLSVFNPETVMRHLEIVLRDDRPAYVILGHTAAAMELAPRIAVMLQSACVTGIVGAERVDGDIRLRRTVCGGKLDSLVQVNNSAVFAIQPGGMDSEPRAPAPPGRVDIRPPLPAAADSPMPVAIHPDDTVSALDSADVVVAAGNGVGDESHLDLLHRLAACFSRSAVAGSRPVCDRGWLPYSAQVGLTGKTVSPALYMACGISGAFQHVLGFREAGTVVAVNRDPGAAIFQEADVGIVEPLEVFLPILIDSIRQTYGEDR